MFSNLCNLRNLWIQWAPFHAAICWAGSFEGEGPLPLFLRISEEIRVMISPTGSGSIKLIAAFRNGLSNICFSCFISCSFASIAGCVAPVALVFFVTWLSSCFRVILGFAVRIMLLGDVLPQIHTD